MTTLRDILYESDTEEEIDEKCVDVFVSDYELNKDSFKKFPLQNYLICARTYRRTHDVGIEMKEKLKKARQKGRGGWWRDECTTEFLYKLLNEHKEKKNKGNNIDLCNFSMFIYFKKYKENLIKSNQEN